MKTKTAAFAVGLLVGGVMMYRSYKTGKKFITETVNPASSNNFIYNVTKNERGEGLGIRLYNWWHGGK